MAMLRRIPMASAPARTLLRPCRPQFRIQNSVRRARNVRFESNAASKTSTSPPPINSASSSSPSGSSSGLVGGLIGGGITLLGVYAWYHVSGTRSVVTTAQKTKQRFDDAFNATTEKAPSPNEAIQWLRQTTSSYASYVPGAKQYVDKAFDGIEEVQKNHEDEVEKIINDAYADLKKITDDAKKQGGPGLDSVSRAWNVLQKAIHQIGDLAGDAAGDLLKQYPELQDKLGGSFSQLQQLRDQYGGEAKKQVDETYSQVKDILKGGIGLGTADQIRRLVQEKLEQLKKAGDQAWSKGMEQVKPYLDKNPQIKELVEKNKEKLVGGGVNMRQLWDKVTNAAKTGDTKELEDFVKKQVDQTKQSSTGSGGNGSGIQDYLEQIVPGGMGASIGMNMGQLQELVSKHGSEAEQLAKDTWKEISQVLERKVQEGEKLVDKAKTDVKKGSSGR